MAVASWIILLVVITGDEAERRKCCRSLLLVPPTVNVGHGGGRKVISTDSCSRQPYHPSSFSIKRHSPCNLGRPPSHQHSPRCTPLNPVLVITGRSPSARPNVSHRRHNRGRGRRLEPRDCLSTVSRGLACAILSCKTTTTAAATDSGSSI